MKKNGFTLVELLAVLVILALLIAIAVPGALKISSNVKTKSYETKIDLIEAAAKNYGQSNLASVQLGKGSNGYSKCKFSISDDEIASVEVDSMSDAYSGGGCESSSSCTYACITTTVEDLVDSGNLEWDYENQCEDGCSSDYKNIIINPKTNDIINKCKIYIYYKNKRVYAYFDEATCSTVAPDIATASQHGNSYINKF